MAALLMLFGAAHAATTAGDYGVAWDDAVQTRYGQLVLDYFLSAGQNRECNDYLDLRFYGPPVELIGAIGARLFTERSIEFRHGMCAMIALLAVPALYRFGRLLGSPWLGVLAALMLFLMPRFYGHAFINSKDIPFAVGMTASLAALASMFAFGRYRWRKILECGILIGITVAIRPGGWMLIGPLYLATAAFADWQQRSRSRRKSRRRSLAKQAALFSIAWLVMIAAWPWAHESPIANPLQAIRMAGKFHLTVPVLFEGEVHASDALPRYYLAKYLLITTPPTVLLLAFAGFAATASQQLRCSAGPRRVAIFVAQVWLGVPLLLFAVLRPNAYDGIRHFLFLLPVIAVYAALGARWLWSILPSERFRWIMSAVLATALAAQVLPLAQLHPYQMTYFNFCAGGVGVASKWYETDYWLTSYKEAIDWVRQQPTHREDDTIRLLVAANENSRWCASYFADDRMRFDMTLDSGLPGDLPADFDYYIATTRSAMDKNFPDAQTVAEIGRAGAVFCRIKQRRTAAGL